MVNMKIRGTTMTGRDIKELADGATPEAGIYSLENNRKEVIIATGGLTKATIRVIIALVKQYVVIVKRSSPLKTLVSGLEQAMCQNWGLNFCPLPIYQRAGQNGGFLHLLRPADEADRSMVY